jgi:hypothetical protein
MIFTPIPTFPHGGRNNHFPRGGNKKGVLNQISNMQVNTRA